MYRNSQCRRLPSVAILFAGLMSHFAFVNAWAEVPDWQHRPWNRDLIYFVMTDRFLDGDPQNNRPAGSDPALYDPMQSDIGKYHGGDFRGLELAIRDGYFTKLGVTAIWITPPLKNAGPGSQ